ncbi:alpha/beta hydrolase [Actinoplanes hulinensis]|uniref:Alpha/beta hydrolase n=1 Tax=Actinoplanes hulinensis TaxID=1144547 RepID=A0ABS7B8A0_9ACTN|nr:alpha/beta hydrolase [Actinoplanes hulinensis]MBW6437220.1 alpha/beta hydrolase [Actinoplanes hulinensis]
MFPPHQNDPRMYGVPEPVTENGHLIWRDAGFGWMPGVRALTLDLYRPSGGGPHPLLIWIHGGAWLLGNKGEAPMLAHGRITERLLENGYAVARVTYRLSAEAKMPAQLHDVKAAVRWLRHHAAALGLDQGRFGAWGESAGGHLASMLALTGDDPTLVGDVGILGVSDAIQSAIIWYGPGNLLSMAAQNHPRGTQDHDAADSPESLLIGGPVQQLPAAAAAASPVSYVSAAAPPMLLVHGDEDRVVPAGQTRELYDRLHAAGAPVTLRLVTGADHGLTGADLPAEVTAALAHLDRTLRAPVLP